MKKMYSLTGTVFTRQTETGFKALTIFTDGYIALAEYFDDPQKEVKRIYCKQIYKRSPLKVDRFIGKFISKGYSFLHFEITPSKWVKEWTEEKGGMVN